MQDRIQVRGQTPASPSRASVLAAFAAVYILWGSTYLAIRFAIETIPPFLMAGTRFLFAGGILYLWTRGTSATKPSPRHWRSAAIIGILLLVIGNGGLTWSEQLIPSGVAALLVATTPLWFVLLDWLWHRAAPPGRRTVAGLLIGIAGAAVLTGPSELTGGSSVNPWGAVALFVATLAWTIGSLYSRKADLPTSPLQGTAMEMLVGGAVLVLLAGATGEFTQIDLQALSLKSALSLGYLVVFGSLIGFSSYIWLLRVTSPERVATYAFVNPIIAVVLGWAFAGEALTPQTIVAATIIVLAVFLIVTGRPLRA